MKSINPLAPQPEKDKVENVKQQQQEVQHTLDKRVIPHPGHTVFEYDKSTKQISKAAFKQIKEIHWNEAVVMYKGKVEGRSIEEFGLITKGKIIQKENCLYIPALNVKNVKKILLRDYNIKVNG